METVDLPVLLVATDPEALARQHIKRSSLSPTEYLEHRRRMTEARLEREGRYREKKNKEGKA